MPSLYEDMFAQLINHTLAVGAVVAAIAIAGVCLVGLLVWIGGWTWKDHKPVK